MLCSWNVLGLTASSEVPDDELLITWHDGFIRIFPRNHSAYHPGDLRKTTEEIEARYSNPKALEKAPPLLPLRNSQIAKHTPTSLPKIRMPRLPRMLPRPLLALSPHATLPTRNLESKNIRVIMPPTQNLAQLLRRRERPAVHLLPLDPNYVEHLPIRRRVCARVRCHGAHVVVDPRVDEDAARRAPFVEGVDAGVLHVDAADFDVEVGAQDAEFDAAAPGVFALDPLAVGGGFFFEHALGVEVRLGLDCLSDDAAELGHTVEGGA